MEVVHVVGGRGGIGGAERVLAAIVSARRGVRHRILLPFASSDQAAGLAALVPDGSISAFGAATLGQLWDARRWLSDRLHARTSDVIHAHLFHASALVASLPLRSLPPAVLTHHHGSLLVDQSRRLETRLDRWAGTRYARVVAVSEAVAGFLLEEYGYHPARVEVIHNGWSGTPQLRREETVNFLTVARLRKEKGHEVLLRAFRLVTERYPDVGLRLVGDGPRRPVLERLAKELGIAEAVEFTGDVADVWSQYASGRVMVVPSLTEPQGIVVLEAMAAGCPIVATSVGGIPEMVQDGVSGRLVPPNDPDALALAMLELHRSASLRETFVEAGRGVASEWRMEETVARYHDLYRRLRAGRK